MKKQLHLGCWHRNIPGFINIDLCDMPHIDYIHDIKTLPMIESESIDLIYTSHTVQYFDREEIINVFNEWNRVLKKGGILRLATSDFEKLKLVYEKYGEIEKIIGPMYGKMSVTGKDGNEIKMYHKTIYDFKSLECILNKCGFSNVKRYCWQDTIHKNYDVHSQAYVPHMDKENGILISLNIEAIKI